MTDVDVSGKAKGGHARAKKLSPQERKEIARRAAAARWEKEREVVDEEVLSPNPSMPIAKWRGLLNLTGMDVPCYVLDNGLRVIGRTSATELLTGIKAGGGLEKYLGVKALEPFINKDLILERMVPFRLLEVEGLARAVKGLPADVLIEICQGFVSALDANLRDAKDVPKMTARQKDMAMRASMFLSACAKVGLDALIDEATGYQYERADDALQVKLAAYLLRQLDPLLCHRAPSVCPKGTSLYCTEGTLLLWANI